jgi:hypothetical protein
MSKRVRIAVFLIALLFANCAAANDNASALEGIEQFHNRFNKQEFSEIYNESDSAVKTAMSKEEFIESMKAMREGQGRVIKTEVLATGYDSSPDARSVKILMLVTFEKGQAKEEFLYHITGDKAFLAGYHFLGNLNSDD